MRVLRFLVGIAVSVPAYAQFIPAWVASHRSGDAVQPYAAATRANGESFAVFTRTISGDDDIALVKFSPSGAVLWERVFHGPVDQDIATDVAVSVDGSAVYVLGRSSAPGFGDSDFVILKYDATTGVLLWQRFWDGGSLRIDSPQALAATPDGGVVATGGVGTTSAGLDFGTVRFDAQGGVLWAGFFRGSGRPLFNHDQADRVVVTPEGDIVVSGIASLGNGKEYRTIRYEGLTGAETWTVSRLSASGLRDLDIAPNGDVLLFGLDPTGIDQQWFVTRYDGVTGALLWDTLVDPGFDEAPASLAIDASGDIFVTGATDTDGDDGNFNDNMLTMALDGVGGAVLWIDNFGETAFNNYDRGNDLWPDGEGGLYVIGSTRSASLVSGPFHSDAIIRRLDVSSGGATGMGLLDTTSGSAPISESFLEAHFDGAGNGYLFGISSGDVGVPTNVLMARYDAVRTIDRCSADLSGTSDPNDPAYGVPDGAIDASDFFYYLDQFVGGNLAVADLSGSSDPNDPAYGVPDGAIDASDFFYYLDLFVAGCP